MTVRDNLIAYAGKKEAFFSAFGREDTAEELQRFYERVNDWCEQRSVRLGEGVLKIIPVALASNPSEVIYSMTAPAINGPDFAFSMEE